MISSRFRWYQESKKNLGTHLGLFRPRFGPKFGFRLIARHRLIQFVRCHTFWFHSMVLDNLKLNTKLGSFRCQKFQNMVFSLYGLRLILSEFTLTPNFISVGPLQILLVPFWILDFSNFDFDFLLQWSSKTTDGSFNAINAIRCKQELGS